MDKHWRYALIPAYPLLALNALVAFLYALVWCRATSWQWREGVLTFIARRPMIGDPAGQGWSWIVGYADPYSRNRADIRVHENVHVWQETMWAMLGGLIAVPLLITGHPVAALIAALSGGPLFALTYGISFVRQWFKLSKPRHWYDAYMQIVYERHAYTVQEKYLDDMSPAQRAETWGHK